MDSRYSELDMTQRTMEPASQPAAGGLDNYSNHLLYSQGGDDDLNAYPTYPEFHLPYDYKEDFDCDRILQAIELHKKYSADFDRLADALDDAMDYVHNPSQYTPNWDTLITERGTESVLDTAFKESKQISKKEKSKQEKLMEQAAKDAEKLLGQDFAAKRSKVLKRKRKY